MWPRRPHLHPEQAQPRRLATRFVGLSMAVLLGVQVAGFSALSASIDQRSRAALSEELQVGERVWQRLVAQRAETLRQGARVLAADYGFRSTLALGDMATVEDALANTAQRLGASMAAWVDTQGVLTAQHDGRGTGRNDSNLQNTVQALARDQGGTQVAMLAGEAYQFVAVPVKAPATIGWVVMGVAVDEAMARDMRTLSGLDVALAITQADGGLKAGPSTLGARAAQALRVHDGQATLDGEVHVVQAVPLVAGNAAQVLLLRSVQAAVAPFRALQWTMLAITAGGLLLFGLFSLLLAQRITTPLRALMRASERLGRGEYSEPVQHLGGTDEVGQLARAFDRMRVNIADHQAEVHRLAYWDRLTGLPNRALFRERVASTLQAGQAPLSVLMLNLDRFKHINDVLGFAFGDEVLKAVGQRIGGQLVRDGDLVARLSGDVFGVLLPMTEANEALRVADRITAAFELPLVLGEQQVDISAGLGVASWPAHAQDADTLIGHAEVAMYTAKRKLATALVYDPGLDVGSEETLSLLTELRQAVEREELRLFLQPKIGLRDGRVVGAEALVRWQHPNRGMVPPMKFIPFAEQTGFVRQLTLWIFEATARAWPSLQALGLQRVSVNLSTRDLMDSELPQRLDRILARHGVTPQAFCLEITESAIMDEPQRAEATLNALAAAGFKLSIDDYGTGYSSLSYVAGLPVHELKIDKSFVMGMATVPKHAAIVRSTIDLAHNLGLSVVAEGVEDAEILSLLRRLECDEAQGYHMSKPVPAADLPAFVQRWQAAQTAGALGSSPALH